MLWAFLGPEEWTDCRLSSYPKPLTRNLMCAMCNELSVSLNLNEEIRLFVQKRLREFASENPQSKFNIICWLDDLNVDLVAEFDDFLVEEDCTNLLHSTLSISLFNNIIFE